MTIAVIVSLLGVGLAVGFLSGLVGVGGGVLIVPFLYFFFAYPEWSGIQVVPSLHAAIAHATSLFIIIPTAIRGTWSYHRAGLVLWRTAVPIGLISILAAVGGARAALALPVPVLKMVFGALLMTSGLQLVTRRRAEVLAPMRESGALTLFVGVIVGFLSALLGIGGGLVAIPLMIYLMRMDVRRVAPTSLAIVVFAATAGTLTYVLSGLGAAELPTGTLGYVHLWIALPILVGAFASVNWGVTANQRLGTPVLKIVFGILFILFGARLLVENALALS
jgi:uncharacterized protein